MAEAGIQQSAESTIYGLDEIQLKSDPNEPKKRRGKRSSSNEIYVELRKNNAGIRIFANSIETFGPSCQFDMSAIVDAQNLVIKITAPTI